MKEKYVLKGVLQKFPNTCNGRLYPEESYLQITDDLKHKIKIYQRILKLGKIRKNIK